MSTSLVGKNDSYISHRFNVQQIQSNTKNKRSQFSEIIENDLNAEQNNVMFLVFIITNLK